MRRIRKQGIDKRWLVELKEARAVQAEILAEDLGSKSRLKNKNLNSERSYEESVGILRSRNRTFALKFWNVATELARGIEGNE